MILSQGDSLQNDKYIIEKQLGKGGFGITYKAQNTFLSRTVVIKTINEENIKGPNNQKYLTRFQREARILAKLSAQRHPHIVQVYDLFEENEIPYLVMEFLSGGSLGNLVRKQGKLSESVALQYISQIGSALEVVHQADLVHRDAHPDNIMILKNQAILIDFGIVGRIDAPYLTNEHPTHFYFAPYEQKDGSIDPKVDIYALAASLYYALTAQYPMPSFNRKLRNESLTPPKELNPTISRQVQAAILKGMELEAKNRPDSMQEWLQLLPSTSSKNNELSSKKGVNYTRLRDFLKAGQWKEADEETLAVMLKASGREKEGYLNSESIENFPCTDLRTIDKLWVEYSNGRFGFSVQKRIWESVGRDIEKLGDRVGWRKGWWMNKEWISYSQVTFDTSAPPGHLPYPGGDGIWVFWRLRDWCIFFSLASRLVKFNL
ncbi:MAG: serine/threonine-protein kinase [Scytonema sp. PMC 1069.18]|nr:serine/threonine-protein kinase [Scytonema sp. PMC 1069.18]MEC4888295.1 serine/threonine-protein kinase [Scytonema sp. PMC 1070.18]